jgi:hypothetical protein
LTYHPGMSWEAFRLTSRSPSELYAVMSPSGVDHLVREMLMDCWRRLPEDQKSLDAWRREVDRVWTRNLKIWSAIKKPSPEAFFQDLAPYEADGHLRQALVLCWMMLPRVGGRQFADVRKIVSQIYDRNVQAWESDNRTFTGKSRSKKKQATTAKNIAKSRKSKLTRKTSKQPRRR